MRISTNTASIARKHGIPRAVKMIADAGFSCADISLFDFELIPEDRDISDLARILNGISSNCGISFNQAHAPFDRYVDGYLAKVVPVLPRVFKLCGALSIPAVIVHPLKDSTKLYSDNVAQMFEINRSFYNSLAPLAEEYGVKIAIENMFHRNPATYEIMQGICADPAEHIALYESLDKKELYTLCLDVGHSVLTDRDPATVIRELGADRLTCLHIHDVDGINDLHTLPGLSKINFDPILRSLAAIDYRGDFTLECDNFISGFEDDFLPTALSFMADRAGYLADRIEGYRLL